MSDALSNKSPKALHLLEQNVDASVYDDDTGYDKEPEFDVVPLSERDKQNAVDTFE